MKPLSPAEKVQIEREQEQKLKSKYPQGAARPMPAAPGGKHNFENFDEFQIQLAKARTS